MKRYELRAEIYTYHIGEQDPDSGGFPDATWDYDNPRYVRATGGSARTWESIEQWLPDRKGFGSTYYNENWIQLFTPYRPLLSARVGNIKNKAGEVIYAESDGKATIFDIRGVFPQVDVNGKTIDYHVVCARSSLQP
ncbi:hypothetical protein [Streptomyces parvulus]|uniref:hypothetical protein n=1 Tax=Streptomyces parvulus TaxID=146923 RepID=UPI0011C080D8|nr:hypothetical protein [Streptomyces parvulus]